MCPCAFLSAGYVFSTCSCWAYLRVRIHRAWFFVFYFFFACWQNASAGCVALRTWVWIKVCEECARVIIGTIFFPIYTAHVYLLSIFSFFSCPPLCHIFCFFLSKNRLSSAMNPVYSPVQPGTPYGNPKNMAFTGKTNTHMHVIILYTTIIMSL